MRPGHHRALPLFAAGALGVALSVVPLAAGQEAPQEQAPPPIQMPEPDPDEQAAFEASVEQISNTSRDRVELERARAHAPFDLEWGLR